jgi:hypothetical protein
VTYFRGYKFVAVGSNLHYSKTWNFFSDFLRDYVPTVFGKEWGDGELAKPFSERHLLVQWWARCREFISKQKPNADASYAARPNGFAAAYFAFAYDLYLVDHNGQLEENLLQRLKHHDQFQGARHELFAEATCLRAGFEIQREDERDGSVRHAEFTATHKQTGQRLSVEAKSKHRPGVLGHPGTPQDDDEVNIRFGTLLNDAIAKNPPHPLVIFLDANLPPERAEQLFNPGTPPRPAKPLINLIDRIEREHGGFDPYILIVITNHPHHYALEDEADPKKECSPSYPKSLPNRLPVQKQLLDCIKQRSCMETFQTSFRND